MSQSLCNSLFLHFYIFLQCEDVLNIVSYIVPPYGAKALQDYGKHSLFTRRRNYVSVPLRGESLASIMGGIGSGVEGLTKYQSPYGAKALQEEDFAMYSIQGWQGISPLTGRKSCKTLWCIIIVIDKCTVSVPFRGESLAS